MDKDARPLLHGENAVDMTRRSLLGAAAAAAAILAASDRALGQALAASDRVDIAVIGAGGMGASDMARLTDQNIVAIADPDLTNVAKRFVNRQGAAIPHRFALKSAYDRMAKYADHLCMFDGLNDIDAVVVATPNHHQALAARMATEQGLHVYMHATRACRLALPREWPRRPTEACCTSENAAC